jgi:hypothetical protein
VTAAACCADSDRASELIADTRHLVLAVAAFGETVGGPSDRRAEFMDELRLGELAHEDAVLAGEIACCLRLEDGESAAVRLRQGIARVSREARMSDAHPLCARSATVDLASLLVRAAGNAAASGSASQASENRTAALGAGAAASSSESTIAVWREHRTATAG